MRSGASLLGRLARMRRRQESSDGTNLALKMNMTMDLNMEDLSSSPVTKLMATAESISERQRELKIESLAGEIGQLIHSANPEAREDLAQVATTLLREEGLRAGIEPQDPLTDVQQRAFNPLASGIGLIVVGAALALLMPFLGLALGGFGAVAVIWGLILSWRRQ